MALPTANFPASIWDGNEQDTTFDGAPDPQFEQAGDHNEAAAEVIAIQNYLRTKKSIQVINKTGVTLAANKWVAASGHDATSGLLTVELADKNTDDFWALGILPAAILDDAEGEVLMLGVHGPLDTTGFGGAGTYWWLDGTGDPRQDPPDTEGDSTQRLARILVEDVTNGFIFVRTFPGFQPVDSTFIRIGTLAASDDRWLLCTSDQVRIMRVAILSDTATAGSTGANNYSFQLRNHTDSQDLIAAPQTTQTGELVVNGRLRITLDQNQVIGAGRVLELQIVKNGAPTDLSAAELAVMIYYLPVPI